MAYPINGLAAACPVFSTQKKIFPVISTSRSVWFGGNTEKEKTEFSYQQELERLRATERPILRKTILKQVPMIFVRTLFPASLMSSVSGLPNLLKASSALDDGLKAQAKFAATKNLDALNAYLPYRNQLVSIGNKEQLAQYDAVLKKVAKEAEFYEMGSPAQFQKQLMASWKTLDYKQESRKVGGQNQWKALWKFFSDRKFRQTTQSQQFNMQGKYIDALSPQKLAAQFKGLKRLSAQDDATRYLVAGQIADLFFKKPQYLEGVLKSSKGHPLRFLINKDSPTMALGSCMNGLNVITLNKTFLWLPKGKNTTAQHEFIHAASGENGLVGDVLPFMSTSQKEEFKEARSWLLAQHETKGSSLYGKLKFWLTGKTATGIRNYAFFNDYEFLTVTLDAFKTNPKGLCQTKAGQKIYDIYKALFGLDPLKDLPQTKPVLKSRKEQF